MIDLAKSSDDTVTIKDLKRATQLGKRVAKKTRNCSSSFGFEPKNFLCFLALLGLVTSTIYILLGSFTIYAISDSYGYGYTSSKKISPDVGPPSMFPMSPNMSRASPEEIVVYRRRQLKGSFILEPEVADFIPERDGAQRDSGNDVTLFVVLVSALTVVSILQFFADVVLIYEVAKTRSTPFPVYLLLNMFLLFVTVILLILLCVYVRKTLVLLVFLLGPAAHLYKIGMLYKLMCDMQNGDDERNSIPRAFEEAKVYPVDEEEGNDSEKASEGSLKLNIDEDVNQEKKQEKNDD